MKVSCLVTGDVGNGTCQIVSLTLEREGDYIVLTYPDHTEFTRNLTPAFIRVYPKAYSLNGCMVRSESGPIGGNVRGLEGYVAVAIQGIGRDVFAVKEPDLNSLLSFFIPSRGAVDLLG